MTARPPASERPCPACGAALAPWADAPGGEPADTRRHELLRCASCGTAVSAGPPPEADAYETGLYAPEPPRGARAVRALMRLGLGQVVRWLRGAGLRPGARVVDAGAGAGLLVEVLRGAGFDAYGIEPGERGVARAAAEGRPVRREAIEEHAARDLDAAVLWHVLEHLADPVAALARVRGWLRPGGLLLVGVPNVGSWQARIAGGGWFHLDVPRHRTHLSAAGARRVLERAGFDVVAERHLVAEHNPVGMWLALLTRLGMTPGFPLHLLKRNVRATPRDVALLAVAGPPLLPVAVVVEALAALIRRGGTVALVAQRRA